MIEPHVRALITESLRKDNKESFELWSVLTALRGPDSNRMMLKRATTMVIRSHFLGLNWMGENAALESFCHADAGPDTLQCVEIRKSVFHGTVVAHKYNPETHFITHAKLAFEALGLKWFELNE